MAKVAFLLLALAVCEMTLSAAQSNVDYTFGMTRVRFLGKSPNFQIYPNTSLPVYLQLKFSKFEERDSSNQKVQKHSVESLASADPTWTAGNTTLSDSTNVTYVRMAMNPSDRNGFELACPGGATPAVNASVVVTLYFGFDQNTSFPYGQNKTVNVSKGGLKFNVEYSNWNFCNDANTLGMEIDLLVKGDAAAQANVSTGSDGSKVLSVPLGNDTTADINFANYAYEAKNGTRNMTVGVTLGTSGGKSTVSLKLPNPKPNTTVYYDPTVTTTQSGTPGAAAGLRVSLWTVLAVVLLSVFRWA